MRRAQPTAWCNRGLLVFEGDRHSEKDRLPRELAIHLDNWSEQWGHTEVEDRAGKMLQSGTVADPPPRPVRAVPKLGFGSAANEAGSFSIKHSSPSG